MATSRKQTKEWEPWYEFSECGTKVICLYCANTFNYKRERAFAHFGYKSKSEKSVCRKVPRAVRERFANCANFVPRRTTDEQMQDAESLPSGPNIGFGTPSSSQSTQNEVTGGGSGDGANTNEGTQHTPRSSSLAGSNSTRSGPLHQLRMNDAMNIAKRKELDEKWASFFYEANVPFNVARNPAFIEAVRATSLARFEYSPPSYHQLRTQLIEPKRLQIERDIKTKTNFAVKNYGVTICSDGWDDVNRRPLMNVMMSCPTGDVFLGAIDTTGHTKSMTYIADQMKAFIEKVGPLNVIQVCTDNAANMLGAMDDIVKTYPWIFKHGCVAHALDLLLEDWAKIPVFKDLMARAKQICQYIKGHHATMSTFRQLSPKKQLLVPSETRFAFHFLMMQRLLELKQVLEELIRHPRVQNYVEGLRNVQGGTQSATIARNVVATIRDARFWHRCRDYVHIVEDVLKALRVFDGREPAMGKAWLTMHNLRGHVHSLREAPFNIPSGLADILEETFDSRWNMIYNDLHYAGALLNPYLKDHGHLKGDGTALRALYRVIRQLERPAGVRFDDCMVELTQYEEGTGPYSPAESPDIRVGNMLPHQWWHRIGDRALSKIAVRILSLTCSASSCERNWSMYSFVHNKSRNRLAVEKAESLVYIYTNSRVLRGKPGADPVRWYEENIYSEDSDPDALGPIPVNEPNRAFDAMQAEDVEEDDIEVNRAPPMYQANMDLWREGADHFEEARNYYGDGPDADDNIGGDCWGPWDSNPGNNAFTNDVPIEGIAVVQNEANTSDTVEADVANEGNDDRRGNDDTIDGHPPQANTGRNIHDDENRGNVDHYAFPNSDSSDHEDGDGTGPVGGQGGSSTFMGGRHVANSGGAPMARTSPTDEMNVDDVMRFDPSRVRVEEDDVPRYTQVSTNASSQIIFPTIGRAQGSSVLRSTLPFASRTSNPTSRPVHEGLGSVGNPQVTVQNISNTTSGGRPPPSPRHFEVGQYRAARLGSRGGRTSGGASSSRAPTRPPRGIGARIHGVNIEPFLETYTPGPTLTTPAFVVPGSRRGPAINSDAEDPAAKRHKKIVNRNRQRGIVDTELRNENSEVEGQRGLFDTDDEDGSGSENEEDDNDRNCDEAPEDDDVCIRDAQWARLSTEEVRRSRRLNNVAAPTE